MGDGNNEHDTDPTGAPGRDKAAESDATTERCGDPPVEADGRAGEESRHDNADTIEDPAAMPIEHRFWLMSVGAAERRRDREIVRQRESEGRDYAAYEGVGLLAVPARPTLRDPAAKVLVVDGRDEDRAATTILGLGTRQKRVRRRAIAGAAMGLALVCGLVFGLRIGLSRTHGDESSAATAGPTAPAPSSTTAVIASATASVAHMKDVVASTLGAAPGAASPPTRGDERAAARVADEVAAATPKDGSAPAATQGVNTSPAAGERGQRATGKAAAGSGGTGHGFMGQKDY